MSGWYLHKHCRLMLTMWGHVAHQSKCNLQKWYLIRFPGYCKLKKPENPGKPRDLFPNILMSEAH